MYHTLNNGEKKNELSLREGILPLLSFFFSYSIEEMRGKPKGGALSFFDRSLFANVHLDVALIVASFSAQPRENDREKRNCKFTTIQIPPWRLQTFFFLDFSSLFFSSSFDPIFAHHFTVIKVARLKKLFRCKLEWQFMRISRTKYILHFWSIAQISLTFSCFRAFGSYFKFESLETCRCLTLARI